MASPQEARDALVRVLQLAYSGERAAARAYAGHWRSVRDPEQKAAIRKIMHEELEHRTRVGEMLAGLGSAPRPWRDRWMLVVGTLIAASCFIGGWYIPMYGAGRIERKNIVEYEVAARWAARAGLDDFAQELLAMAEVEWDHEAYFHGLVRSHWLHRVTKSWPDPGPRQRIRVAFEARPPAGASPETTSMAATPGR